MAFAIPPSTWENGFKQPTTGRPWVWDHTEDEGIDDPNSYVTPPSKEIVTSEVHNDLGVNVIRTWPTLYDGTNSPHGAPSWWKPAEKVDVLISGGKHASRLTMVCSTLMIICSWTKWTCSRG